MTSQDNTLSPAATPGIAAAPRPSLARRVLGDGFSSWALAMPVTLVLGFFLLAPIVMIVAVSFWGSTSFSIYPAFLWDNYEYLFGSQVTYSVFFKTLRFAAMTWAFSLVIGFTVAFYLSFHIRS